MCLLGMAAPCRRCAPHPPIANARRRAPKTLTTKLPGTEPPSWDHPGIIRGVRLREAPTARWGVVTGPLGGHLRCLFDQLLQLWGQTGREFLRPLRCRRD